MSEREVESVHLYFPLKLTDVKILLSMERDFIQRKVIIPSCRAYQFAGEDGCLSKKNFIKILRSSDLFMKSFDKNRDGVVTEVRLEQTSSTVKPNSPIFFSDRHDDQGGAGVFSSGQRQ